MADLDLQSLEESVRDCLTHLYDYSFLQDHPLVRLLVPQMQANSSRVQTFRQVIFEAIERLKPDNPNTSQTKNSRLYSILQLRYQQQQQVQFVLKQLNLGERQFYRDHARAVQSLARVLEDYLKEITTAPLNNTLSIQSELERLQRQNISLSTNSEAFLQKTLNAVKNLSERQQTKLNLQITDTELPGSIDQTLLRQVIIWIVSQLLVQFPPHSSFTISFSVSRDMAQFSFRQDGEPATAETNLLVRNPHDTLETMLNALGGKVYEGYSHGNEVILEIPYQQHAILIIEDNPDVIALFRQYLLGQPYQIFTAIEGVRAIELASQINPKFIILDVLLPDQDGWEILQALKNNPATFDTPVLICSVLEAPELAVLLGADGFLHKPPEESEFLNALTRFTAN